eukprot:3733034-Rhodomonas_salina.2
MACFTTQADRLYIALPHVRSAPGKAEKGEETPTKANLTPRRRPFSSSHTPSNMSQQYQPHLDMRPHAQASSKKNIFAGRKTLGASFASKSKRDSIEIDELSQGNNAVPGEHVPSHKSGKGWMGSMMSKLKGGTSRPTTAPAFPSPSPSPQQTDEETRYSEAADKKQTSGSLLARDSQGRVLSDIKQARVKALQQDLLKLVKDAENSGLVKGMELSGLRLPELSSRARRERSAHSHLLGDCTLVYIKAHRSECCFRLACRSENSLFVFTSTIVSCIDRTRSTLCDLLRSAFALHSTGVFVSSFVLRSGNIDRRRETGGGTSGISNERWLGGRNQEGEKRRKEGRERMGQRVTREQLGSGQALERSRRGSELEGKSLRQGHGGKEGGDMALRILQ